MLVSNAIHLVSCGCPAQHASDIEGFGLPLEAVEVMAKKGVSWIALVMFLKKYEPLVPEFIKAYQAGFNGVMDFVLAHVAELPALLADFVAMFPAATAQPPSPIIA